MEIRPFRGWRYQVGRDGDLGARIAPPYDILSAEDKRRLLGKCETNIVAVDMPYVPPQEVGPDEVYQAAADRLRQWQASGVLRPDDRPAVYAYEQTFQWASRSYSRRSLICGVRATPFGQDVLPHERTFDGPKADRMRLTEYTRMQLSPVFGIFEDAGEAINEVVWATLEGVPDMHGELGGVTEKLWVVTDDSVISAAREALRDVCVVIADGHHRYLTGLEYGDALRAGGQIHDDHEANFVMFALAARDDPDVLVLPAHRIVRGLAAGFSVARLVGNAPAFDWQRCSVDDADLGHADEFLHRYGPGAMALLGADPAEIWIGRLHDPGAMAAAAPDQPDAWRALDVAILHKLIIDRALEPWRTEALFIEYTPDGRAVLAACESGRADLGICLQAAPLSAVEAVAQAGASMPHKSTYFYPKISTGLVLKPLE